MLVGGTGQRGACRRAWWSLDRLPRAEGPSHVTTRPAMRHVIIIGFAVCSASFVGSGAHAQGKLEARYAVTLGGVSFGQGSWTIDVGADQYTASVSGTTVGLVRIFASGQEIGRASCRERGQV